MSPPNKITELPPGFIAFAKSMKPNQIDSLNALMHTSAPDAATRSVATAAVILTMGQIAGPLTVIEPPGFLLINATGASGDPIDSTIRKCIVLHHLDPTGKPERAKYLRHEIQTLFKQLEAAKIFHGGDVYGAQKAMILGRDNAELRGGGRSGSYSTRYDPVLGWEADDTRHSILRLTEDKDCDAFRDDLLSKGKKLLYPVGVGIHGKITDVRLSISGSIMGARHDREMVDAVLANSLPVLFLPHLAKKPLVGVLDNDLMNLANRITALAGTAPIARIHSDLNPPESDWHTLCYRRLRARLSYFPSNYEFFVNRTIRELVGLCWGISLLAIEKATPKEEQFRLFENLFICCCHAILLSVETLVWHGYGFHCQDHEQMKNFMRVLRSQQTVSKRELLRKAQWLNADERDKLLEILASEGLVETSQRDARAIPFNEFVANTPKRKVIVDPVFICAPTPTQPVK